MHRNHALLDHSSSSSNNDEATVWEWLDRTLVQPSSACPLLHDALQEQEQAVVLVPPVSWRSGATPDWQRRGGGRQKRPHRTRPLHWFQCGLCWKTFGTRYYLDRHLERHHGEALGTHADDLDDSCPAITWCAFLGAHSCQDTALEEEPYYDRGSGGLGDDRDVVRRKVARRAHDYVCTVETIRHAQNACHAMVHECFGGTESELGTYLTESYCSTLACPHLLYQLWSKTLGGTQAAALVLKQVHEWEEDWIYWSKEHHEMGKWGFALLLVLVLFYGLAFWNRRHRDTFALAPFSSTHAPGRPRRRPCETPQLWPVPSSPFKQKRR